MAQPQPATSAPKEDPVHRIETPDGTVSFQPLTQQTIRATCGKAEGWLRMGGREIYATVMMRRASGSDVWVIDPVHSAATETAGGMAGDRLGGEERDAAYLKLNEAFRTWLADNPDLLPSLALAERRQEERAALGRIRNLEQQIEQLRETLPGLRKAVEEAEADLELATAGTAGPRP